MYLEFLFILSFFFYRKVAFCTSMMNRFFRSLGLFYSTLVDQYWLFGTKPVNITRHKKTNKYEILTMAQLCFKACDNVQCPFCWKLYGYFPFIGRMFDLQPGIDYNILLLQETTQPFQFGMICCSILEHVQDELGNKF